MAISQVEDCKGARAAEERSRLYTLAPLSGRSLALPFFLFFLTFQSTATFGVVVGATAGRP